MAKKVAKEYMEVQESVARGVKLLDKLEPKWFLKVKTTPDMACESQCVLGYVYENYGEGLELLANKALAGAKVSLDRDHTPSIDGYHYGFNLARQDPALWEVMGQAWMRAVNRRRAALKKKRAATKR